MLGREHAIGHPALTDGATGLANRLQFELVYSYLFHGADRGVPLTVLLVSTSDRGEDALQDVGSRLQRVTRAADLVAYLEHGRFAILLLGCNLSGGRIAADRVEAALAGAVGGGTALGLASYHAEMKEPHELLEAADRALRAAEEHGGGLEMA